jgi:hypothetical protein
MAKQKLTLKPKQLATGTEVVNLRNGRSHNLRNAKNDAQMVRSDEKRLQALKLRFEDHKPYREIASELNCSTSDAYTYVNETWAKLIENIVELQIAIKSNTLSEIDEMCQQLRPYIFDKRVTIIAGYNKDGDPIPYEQFDAMIRAIPQMIKLLELQNKVAGTITTGKSDGESLGEKTITDGVIMGIAKVFYDSMREKKANVKELAA